MARLGKRATQKSLRSLRLCARQIQNKNLSVHNGFAPLASRVLALPRRSCFMVSSRAYSSPAHQPASRHSIKPFSIHPLVANIRCTAGLRSQDIWRRRDECSIRHSAVSTSQYRLAIWDGCSSNVCYDGYSYRTRVQLEDYGKSRSGTF